MIRKAYPSDVTNEEWEILERLLPSVQATGRPRQVDLREIMNGIFYVLRSGCSWRAMLHDLPPWQTVYNYFQHWQRLGLWQKIHTQLRQKVRKSLEKTDKPTAAIIDSQSVKTAEKRGKYMVTTVVKKLKDASDLSSLIH
jgi:putative transposase